MSHFYFSNFGIFYRFFVLLKLTCLVTLFDSLAIQCLEFLAYNLVPAIQCPQERFSAQSIQGCNRFGAWRFSAWSFLLPIWCPRFSAQEIQCLVDLVPSSDLVPRSIQCLVDLVPQFLFSAQMDDFLRNLVPNEKHSAQLIQCPGLFSTQ